MKYTYCVKRCMAAFSSCSSPGFCLNQISVMASNVIHATSTFYVLFCLPLLCFFSYPPFPCTLPDQLAKSHQPLPTSWALRFASVTMFWLVCSFLIAHRFVWLTRFVSGCLLTIVRLFLCLYVVYLPPFPYLPSWKNKPSHTPCILTHYCNWQSCSYPLLSSVGQLCFSVFLFMAPLTWHL